MHRITKVLYSGAIACSIVAGGVVTASATNIGNEGCTPGYWKNHTSNWQEYRPTQKAGSVFRDARAPFTGVAGLSTSYPSLAKLTLAKALDGGGGTGDVGAAKILLRAATAAYLNAAHEGVGYPLRRFDDPGQLENRIVGAFASKNRDTMLTLAAELDRLNNLGCPLN